MLDVVTVGGALQDIIFFSKEAKFFANRKDPLCQKLICFELGDKIYSQEACFTFGGGAANMAVGLSRLGLKTGILARVGNDFRGKEIIENLKKEKVNASYLQIDAKAPTSISFIVSAKNSGKQVIFSYRGANDNLKVPQKKIPAKWFAVSSLSFSNWYRIFDFIIKQKSKILWNPGHPQIRAPFSVFKKYIAQVTIFTVNEDEAREIVFRKLRKKETNLKKLMKEIYLLGPEIVVITRGKRGAVVFDGQNFYSRSAKKTKVVNVTGAGDAFTSGFLAGFIRHSSLEKALEGGILNSASVISKIGAQKGLLFKN